MNFFDIITCVAVIWAVVSGLRSGFTAQLFSLAGIIAGLLLAMRFGPDAGAWTGIDPRCAGIVGFAAVFIAVAVAAAILARLLKGLASLIGLRWLDLLLGIALSTAKALLILCIVYSAYGALNDELKFADRKYETSSHTFRPIRDLSGKVYPYFQEMKRAVADAGKDVGKEIEKISEI